MNRIMSIVFVAVLAVFLGFVGAYAQQQGSGMGQGSSQGGWFCPYCGHGQGMTGGGTMNCPWMGQGGSMGQGGHMHGMGPGMTGQGGMRGQAGMGQARQTGPVSEDEAKTLVENYLKSMNNPNLKLGKLTGAEGKDYYEAEILTKEGSLVDKLQVNKNTGWFRSAYVQ